MDADTFVIEPDYALIKYKALAGGGHAVIVNRLIEPSLKRLGYSDSVIAGILAYVNVHGVVQNAPGLLRRHYSVFDTAVPAKKGARFLSPHAHIEMMAACQPFLSGAISKTVNLPEEATEDDISDAYLYGYDLGLKAMAVYRANSKAASVMFTSADALKQRQNIDLGSRNFDVEAIFRKSVNPMHRIEEASEQPAFVHQKPEVTIQILESFDDEDAEAIEMPTYGCKDGACSI